MDMEEYFDYTQEKLKKIIKEVKGIGVSDYHPMIKKACKDGELKDMPEDVALEMEKHFSMEDLN